MKVVALKNNRNYTIENFEFVVNYGLLNPCILFIERDKVSETWACGKRLSSGISVGTQTQLRASL